MNRPLVSVCLKCMLLDWLIRANGVIWSEESCIQILVNKFIIAKYFNMINKRMVAFVANESALQLAITKISQRTFARNIKSRAVEVAGKMNS